jgi:cobyric acid synthase
MMSEEEGWIKHGKKAIKRVFENKILRKLFREGVRVMKLDYHEQVTEHFDNLSNHFETTLDLLKDLKFNSVGFPEYQDVLGYLRYWSEEH